MKAQLCFQLVCAFLMLITLLVSQALLSQQLYGMTSTGGNGFGSIVSLGLGAISFSSITPITGNGGGNPQYTRVVEALDGKLYGTKAYGGSYSNGVIYEYDPFLDTYEMQHHFTAADGQGAYSPLILASDGNIYGTCFGGGAGAGGTIFRFDYTTFAYTVLYNLVANIIQGYWNSTGGLKEVAPGKFLRFTQFGEISDASVIYEFDFNTLVYA